MKLDRDLGRSLLKEMVRIRRFEEKCAELYSAGKIRGFLHLYIGEEAVAAGAMRAFGPEDAILATYREHGHALVRGIAAGAVMAEMYGKVEGCSHGRGGSMHIFDAPTPGSTRSSTAPRRKSSNGSRAARSSRSPTGSRRKV